jgi:acetyl esterase/lipase
MLPINRRQLILAGTMAALTQVSDAAPVHTGEPGGKTLLLWPDGAPGAGRVTAREEIVERLPDGPLRDRFVHHVTRPLLTLFPPRGKPNGVTLLIIPGGAYLRVVIDKEGFEAAEWFSARGFTAAVLRYRLPGDGWPAGADAPVHDAIRAMRLLRADRHSENVGASKLGVMGYSAGGHVAARLITEPTLDYARYDEADTLSSRPDFAILVYPVILMGGANAHSGSAQELLTAGGRNADLRRYSADLNVAAGTPRTMLVHAADDPGVPVANSLAMYAALRKANVRSELHVFDRGGHGFGLRAITGKTVAAWPTLAENWALNDE